MSTRIPPETQYVGTPGQQQQPGRRLTPPSWLEVARALTALHTYAVLQPCGNQVTTDPAFRGTPYVTQDAIPGVGDAPDPVVHRQARTSFLAHHFEKLDGEEVIATECVLSGTLQRDLDTRMWAHQVAAHHGVPSSEEEDYSGDPSQTRRWASWTFDELVALVTPETYLDSETGYEEAVRAHMLAWPAVSAITWGTYQEVLQFDSEAAVAPNAPRPAEENDTWAYYGSQCGAWNCASGDLPYARLGLARLTAPMRAQVTTAARVQHDFDTPGLPDKAQCYGDHHEWESTVEEPFVYVWAASLSTAYPYRAIPTEE